MYNNSNSPARAVVIAAAAILLFLLCAIQLVRLQIVNGKEYRKISEDKLYVSMTVKAPRGEISDRYGSTLVGNRTGFSVQIRDTGMKKTEFSDMLKELLILLEKEQIDVRDTLPISTAEPLKFTFKKTDSKSAKQVETDWKEHNGFKKDATCEQVVDSLSEKYEVDSNLDMLTRRKITGVIYDMKQRGFSATTPYTIATDVSKEVVAVVRENNLNFPSVEVAEEAVRSYPNGNMAAHILGTVGVIYQEEYEKLKDKNYALDAVIGKQGIEYSFEDYLRGKDGIKGIAHSTKNGEALVQSVPASPGNQVLLTLDSSLQETTEKKLEETISSISATTAPDCNAGAAVCIDVNSGEILSIASYPTYNPAEYNKKYDELVKNKANPLWNRALAGTYEPGSTFKMLTAIAALEEGIITPEETILDEGVYKYYKDYQPICLEWRYGKTHGYVNTELALQESCNYYFYDIGRRLGIDKLVHYAELFGLGSVTGIEVGGEAKGIIASPKNKKERGETWYDGDTLQAAIGQSDNLFTPIQLANYVATIANGGTRYKPHLLKSVKNTETGAVVREGSPVVEEEIKMTDSTLKAVKGGMKKVTEEGTAKSAFKDFDIAVGGKTGTAEVPNGSSNGIFVAFAPFDNPTIAVAIVLEHGGHGSAAAPIARAIFETYFENKGIEDAFQQHVLLK